MFLGQRIRMLRENKNLSLRQLAKISGITSFSYLANIERGVVDDPGIKTMIKIAKGLEATLDELVHGISE